MCAQLGRGPILVPCWQLYCTPGNVGTVRIGARAVMFAVHFRTPLQVLLTTAMELHGMGCPRAQFDISCLPIDFGVPRKSSRNGSLGCEKGQKLNYHLLNFHTMFVEK